MGQFKIDKMKKIKNNYILLCYVMVNDVFGSKVLEVNTH